MSTINIHAPLLDEGVDAFAAYMEIEREGDVPLRYLQLRFGNDMVTVFLPENHVERRQLLERIRTKIDEGIEAAQKAIVDANHAELTVVRHDVPDPPTQEGCTSCGGDLRHGFRVNDRVVMIAPMTARQHGIITGFALDKADVVVDGRNYPTTIHTKWLALEELVDAPAVTPATIDDRELSALDRQDADQHELAGGRPDPDAEGIRRDLARENAFFTRTQGWDPSRPDGE